MPTSAVTVAAVGRAAPSPVLPVAAVQEQPPAGCVIALLDAVTRNLGNQVDGRNGQSVDRAAHGNLSVEPRDAAIEHPKFPAPQGIRVRRRYRR
jgi:hypothetical protein